MKPIYYKSGYRYQLTRTYQIHTGIYPSEIIKHKFFTLACDGCLTIRASYAWDGASGGIDTKNFIAPSLVHDCGCQMVNEGLLPREYRKKFDLLLFQQCRAQGMSWIRAKWVYHAVRFYADKFAKYKPEPERIA